MRGDIYRLRLGDTKGHEQRGNRYGVIVQADEFNLLSTCLVAPTSHSARPATFRPEVEIDGTRTRILVEQTRAVNHSRIGEWAGRLTRNELDAVATALRLVLEL